MILSMLLSFVIQAAVAQTPSAPAAEKPAAAAKEEQVLKKYSLEEINSAGTYLSAVYEASLDGKKKKILACDPDPSTAQSWLSGPVHAMLDEKTAEVVKNFKDHPDHELAAAKKKWAKCAAKCQCNAYLGITESLDANDPKVAALKTELEQANKKQSAEKAAKCAAQQKWFCKSALRKYLESNRDS